MSFPAYSSYQDSGVSWLGEVPSHWHIDRFKASVRDCRNGIWGEEPDGGEDDVVCVRVADFDRTRLTVRLDEPTRRKVHHKERQGRLLRRGDLLIEKSGGGEKQPVGVVVLYDHDEIAVCSNFVARMELAEDLSPRFWLYVHAAAYSIRLTQGSINQTSGIQNLDQGRYFDERAPYPPAKEQAAIAAFLDRETGKIDALVEEQKRLIDLLKEKRQAVISHAVTKGLNPDAPMQDSGVGWLGEVPAQWTVTKLGRSWKLQGGYAFSSSEFGHEGVAVVRMNNLDRGRLNIESAARIPLSVCNEKVVLTEGDLIWGMSGSVGDTGSLGNYARVVADDLPCQLNQRVGRFQPLAPNASLDYLEWVIQTRYFYEQILCFVTGTAQFNVSSEQVQSCFIAVPPAAEQIQIVETLNKSADYIDRLISEAEAAIQLLSERRAALIFSAVTGKVDVRGAVAPLSDDAAAVRVREAADA